MARHYDTTLKELLDAFAIDWVSWIAPRIGLPADVKVEPVDADLSTISAEADKIFRLGPPQVGFLHLEPQSSWDESAPGRFLLYNVLIEHRLGGPVYTVVLLLRRKANSSGLTGQLQRSYPDGEVYLDFRYQVIRLWELPAEQFLQGGVGTLPLALLTDDAEPQLPAVLAKIADRVRIASLPPAQVQRLLSASYILLGLRYDNSLIDRLFQGVQEMEDSTTYQAILRKGRQKGLVEARQEDVLSVLVEKFGTVSPVLEEQIRSASDPDQLKRALLKIAKIQSIDDFKL